MLLTEVSPSSLNPVPLSELAAHLRLGHGFSDDGSEDALLELYLRNATAVIERRTNGALISRGFSLRVPAWGRHGHLYLPIGPVSELTSFEIKAGGTTTTMDLTSLSLDPGSRRQRLTALGGGPLPRLPRGGVAEFGFTAGYGSSWNDVPDDLRQAVLILAAHYYEARDTEAEADYGLPFGLSAILERHTAIRL